MVDNCNCTNYMKSNLTELFQTYQLEKTPPTIILEDINHRTVGVLYLNMMPPADIIISETQTTEHFFLLVNGVGIYFSFFKKYQDV